MNSVCRELAGTKDRWSIGGMLIVAINRQSDESGPPV